MAGAVLPLACAGAEADAPGPRPASVDRFYLPQLDVLRFFAFLVVFASHALQPIHFSLPLPGLVRATRPDAASYGVDLFFVLSAYLITSLLLRERRITGGLDVKSFYIRRILRIWPLYFFFLTLALAAYLWASRSLPMPALGGYFLGLFFLVGNFVFCLKGVPGPFLGPLWSICVEEQFYLLWPPIVRWASRRRILAVGVLMILVGEATRILSALRGYEGNTIWCNTFARLDPIAAGVILAVAPYETLAGLRPLTRGGFFLGGAGCWIVGALLGDMGAPAVTVTSAAISYPAGTLGSVAFLLGSLGAANVGKGRLGRGLIYLGRISYGLYIYHSFALIIVQSAVLPRAVGESLLRGWPLWMVWFPYLITGFLLSVIISAASYRWLESPFLRLKRRFTVVPSRPV